MNAAYTIRRLSRGRKSFDGRRSGFVMRGFADVLAGGPFPRDFDAWKEIDQRNYESGRLHGANIKFCGLVKKSAGGASPSSYARYRDLREVAIVRAGPPVPVAQH